MNFSRMKWGMICSIEDPKLIPNYEKFGIWMVTELQNAAIQLHFWHCFMPSPNFLLHAKPGSVEEVNKCYDTINDAHPDVSYVIHVLPSKDSIEHQLLKELTHNGALIGQGVLAENALNYFKSYNLEEVMFRMNQWIDRRLTQITARPNDNIKPSRRKKDIFRMDVANSIGSYSFLPQPINHMKKLNSNSQNLDYAVGVVLHRNQTSMSSDGQTKESTQNDRNVSKTEAKVIVKGFPANFNKFEVASLFSDFRPLDIEYCSVGEAIVQFRNKYHAEQVLRNYNGLSFENENFTLEVRAAEEYQHKLLQDKLTKLRAADMN